MLRRPPNKTAPLPPSPAPEIEVTDVTRLSVVFDNHLSLDFDLGKDDGFIDEDDVPMLFIRMGERQIKLSKARILYLEVRPEKVTRVAPAK